MARVETSPITADDTGPAARFLHTELNSAVSVARWQALLQPSWPDAGPNRGFQLTVDGEVVIPQPGGFYGGWITSWIAGPFKGVPGSMGW